MDQETKHYRLHLKGRIPSKDKVINQLTREGGSFGVHNMVFSGTKEEFSAFMTKIYSFDNSMFKCIGETEVKQCYHCGNFSPENNLLKAFHFCNDYCYNRHVIDHEQTVIQ